MVISCLLQIPGGYLTCSSYNLWLKELGVQKVEERQEQCLKRRKPVQGQEGWTRSPMRVLKAELALGSHRELLSRTVAETS